MVAPGATRTVKVVVTVGSRAPAGSEVSRLVTISSASDPLVKDVVRYIVQTALTDRSSAVTRGPSPSLSPNVGEWRS